MLLKEYRIPFPATLEEYRIGMCGECISSRCVTLRSLAAA